jgi:hypothetical protein
MIRRKSLHVKKSGEMEVKLQMNRNEIGREEQIDATLYKELEMIFDCTKLTDKPIEYIRKTIIYLTYSAENNRPTYSG